MDRLRHLGSCLERFGHPIAPSPFVVCGLAIGNDSGCFGKTCALATAEGKCIRKFADSKERKQDQTAKFVVFYVKDKGARLLATAN